jgi:branched-chain amino acid transport system ATP-binding protein
MLKVEGLNTFYGHIHALKDVSFSFNEKDMACVIGANGAGKSTLLKSLIGLVKPQKGVIQFFGKEITSLPTHEIVHRGIGLVPERRQLFGPLSVLDNLKLGAFPWIRNAKKSEVLMHLEWIYRLFPILKERHFQKAGTLSGGQQQMLAIGRALMSRVKLLLLDEPSLGLAPMVVIDIFKTLVDLHQEGLTIVLVEQNAQLALKVSQFGYILENGRMSLQGRASDLLNDEKVKHAYLGKRKEEADR